MNPKELPNIENVILKDDKEYVIDDETIELSKDFVQLSTIEKKKNRS